MTQRTDSGYALITAIVAMLVFASFALTLLEGARATVVATSAASDRARLAAAAEAGLLIAVAGLDDPDPATRWSFGGQARMVRFGDVDLAIMVEDEAGKVPLNFITEVQARTMFEALVYDRDRAGRLADAFLDWRDDDDDVRAGGAEFGYYAQVNRYARNGPLRSIDELATIRGFDRALVDRLRPAVTVSANGAAGFDPRFARPLAIAVMSGGEGSIDAIAAERQARGQRTAIAFSAPAVLVGRPMTVRVVARGEGDARYERATILEITGRPSQRYVVRSAE